jgi:two-component system chemotaxis sensor kinase CheA
VPIEQLDHLMNLVGELVLARNHLVQIVSGRQDDELTEPVQRLKVLITSLQDRVMRTRMQPVRTAWRKYPRIVRDLGKQCGKQVELELQGGDTELDKSMLEAIADPLVHLVRNAVDHGIEKPYLRKIKGKPETGRLVVRAFQESGQVQIEILDDGAGLDLQRVRQKAVAAGILTPDRALVVSESELQESVFLPGFTTAERVTDLSGRGVGMDVVKTTIEQIGGTIELETRKDVGTTVRLTVPLTLAIIPAFFVVCGRQQFAVPQLNVVELLRLRGDEQPQACDHFHDAPVLRLRGELLPLVDLCPRLGLASASDLAKREQLHILVVKTGTRRFALVVDEIGDAQEIVVKPLGSLFTNRPEFSGAALMGDGGIALILDVLGIARAAGLLDGQHSLLSGAVVLREETSRLDEQVLVCEVDGDRRIALPLADVVRLEQIPPTQIEHSASGDRLQYLGHNLPLRHLSHHPGSHKTATAEFDSLTLVVYRQKDTQLGLLVDRIVDVAPCPSQIQTVDLPEDPGSKCRVTATAVVLGRITDFVEVN